MPITNCCFIKQTLNLFLFLFLPFIVAAQDKLISGVITDSRDGAPVADVTINAKGTNRATKSAKDGSFQLAVGQSVTALVISSVGYATTEVDITNKTSVNISLDVSNTSMNEVIVIGYGTVKKADVTSSISNLTEKQFNRGPFQSVDQLIQGKVPGLNISRSGNDPNGTASIILRGVGSFGGSTAPFYVIDGVPALSNEVINSISPDNIASVDVLKDASATAIYGTRGANGVIVITTKKPKAGQLFVNYSGTYGMDEISKRFEVANVNQLKSYLASTNQSLPASVDDGANTDWQKVISRRGYTSSHNISFGGGNTNSRYIASVNYFDQYGVIKTSSNNRLTARLNADFSQLDNKLRFGMQLLAAVTNSQFVKTSDVINNALLYSPAANVYNPDGTFRQTGQLGDHNPLSLLELYSDRKKGTTLSATATMALDILPGLTYNLVTNFQRDLQDGKVFADDKYPDLTALTLPQGIFGGIAQARQYHNFNERKLLETYFNYTKDFGAVNLRALAGYSWQNDQTDGFGAGTRNVISNTVGANNLALSNPPEGYNGITASSLDDDRLISMFGRVEAGYDSKYLLTLTVRRDGSNKFGLNNRWANFPAASVAWRITNEKFMQDQTLFSDLKVRIGYGISGEKNLPNYASIYRYTNSGYGTFFFNGGYLPALGLNQAFDPNPNLKWQTTYVMNGGIDFGFLNNRITGSLDFYRKDSRNLLYRVNVGKGPNTGAGGTPIIFGRQWQNVGEVQNKGVELQINVQAYQSKDFSWTTSFNGAYNKGKIISVTNNSNDTIDYSFVGGAGLTDVFTQRLYAGAELGTFYLYEWTGTVNGVQQFTNGAKEVISGVDNLNNRIDQQAKFGSSLPKLTVGWSNSFAYKNFDLNVFLRGQFGNKILNVTAFRLERDPSFYAGKNIPVRYLNTYNTEATPAPSTKYLERGDFVRLDNITLGYNLPNFSSKIKTLRVFATVINAAVFTSYSGVDPELSLNFNQANDTGALAGGNDFGVYPKTRTYSLGLNLGL